MADNRIYIRCNKCGDSLLIGKSFGGFGWRPYSEKPDKHLEDYLNEFYCKHDFCLDDPVEQKQLPYSLDEYPLPRFAGVYMGGDYSIVYEDGSVYHWVVLEDDEVKKYVCENCGAHHWHQYNYCHDCGTRMKRTD